MPKLRPLNLSYLGSVTRPILHKNRKIPAKKTEIGARNLKPGCLRLDEIFYLTLDFCSHCFKAKVVETKRFWIILNPFSITGEQRYSSLIEFKMPRDISFSSCLGWDDIQETFKKLLQVNSDRNIKKKQEMGRILNFLWKTG